MLLTPSEEHFAGLLSLAAESGTWDGADQGLLNEYFGGENGSGSEGRGGGWHRLPFTYNTTALGGYMYAPAYQRYGSQVKVAHFIGENKPWRTSPRPTRSSLSGRSDNMAARWWNTYNSYYPSPSSTPNRGSGSDVEVRVTDKGVEVVQLRSSAARDVPVYTSAWDSTGSDASVQSRGGSLDDLRQALQQGSSGSSQVHQGEGRYERLPLFDRIDLLAPQLRPQASSHLRVQSSQSSRSATPPAHEAWDATRSAPPQTFGPSGYQMRDPPKTFYIPNAWDQSAEEERRRRFLNPNLRGDDEGKPFGYIPPEARGIHTYDHLGGEKPDENKVTAVFPWEQTSSTSSRAFPTTKPSVHPRVDTRESQPTATRRFDDYTAPPSSGLSEPQHAMPSSLVERYASVWESLSVDSTARRAAAADTAAATSPPLTSSTQLSGQRSRKDYRSGASGPEDAGAERPGGTRSRHSSHRPKSHYVANNYDEYQPTPPSSGPASGLSSALARAPSSVPSEHSADDSLADSREFAAKVGGGGGGGNGVGGFGEVEGSGSWSSSLADIVRLGNKAGGASGVSGSPGSSAIAGTGVGLSSAPGGGHASWWGDRFFNPRGGSRTGQRGTSKYRTASEEGDGDDESSDEEERLNIARSRAGKGGNGKATLSPDLALGGTMSESAASTTGATSPPTSALSGTSSPIVIPSLPREGAGYIRKSLATDKAQASMTPRSPPRSHPATLSNLSSESSSPNASTLLASNATPTSAAAVAQQLYKLPPSLRDRAQAPPSPAVSATSEFTTGTGGYATATQLDDTINDEDDEGSSGYATPTAGDESVMSGSTGGIQREEEGLVEGGQGHPSRMTTYRAPSFAPSVD